MPCLFGSDERCQVMVLHASWLMQYAQRCELRPHLTCQQILPSLGAMQLQQSTCTADDCVQSKTDLKRTIAVVAGTGAAGEPLVVAGDFNVKPQDETYRMMTTGKIDPTHP